MEQEDAPVFDRNLRRSLASSLNLAAAFRDIDRRRISNRPLRPMGDSLMFAVGFEIEILTRYGGGPRSPFRTYFRRDEHALSSISRRMMGPTLRRAGGKRGFPRHTPWAAANG